MAELALNKLIVIILIILVLALVVFLIFRPEILDWIKGQPDYKYNFDEELDFSKYKDQLAQFNCEVLVGKVGSTPLGWGIDRNKRIIYFWEGGKEVDKDLYLETQDGKQGEIGIRKYDAFWRFVGTRTNPIVGTIKDKKITIKDEAWKQEKSLLVFNNAVFRSDIPGWPICKTKAELKKDEETLKVLNGLIEPKEGIKEITVYTTPAIGAPEGELVPIEPLLGSMIHTHQGDLVITVRWGAGDTCQSAVLSIKKPDGSTEIVEGKSLTGVGESKFNKDFKNNLRESELMGGDYTFDAYCLINKKIVDSTKVQETLKVLEKDFTIMYLDDLPWKLLEEDIVTKVPKSAFLSYSASSTFRDYRIYFNSYKNWGDSQPIKSDSCDSSKCFEKIEKLKDMGDKITIEVADPDMPHLDPLNFKIEFITK